MAKYKMKYWFEWGGTCLWSANDAARKEFGYAYEIVCAEEMSE